MKPYPLLLERTVSRRLWGGERLAGLLSLEPSGIGDPYGESWQVWGGNRITHGPLAGRTLQEAADMFGAELLGSVPFARHGTQVPLLAKLIDAAQDLSLQVHPDDTYALANHADSGHLGKTESWLILDAKPGAFVYWGFRQTVGREQVRAAITEGSLTELLNRVPVRPGDVIHNPAGTVHAIGAGVLLFEIQQSSDLTYRLYDFGRRDSQGNLRELHVEPALDVADLSGGEHALVSRQELRPGEVQLVACEHYAMTSIIPDRLRELRTTPASFEIVTAVDGPVGIGFEADQWQLPTGTSLVLPAADVTYSLVGNGRLIRCFVPD